MSANPQTVAKPLEKEIVQGDIVGRWVAERTGGTWIRQNSIALGLVSDHIHAGVILNNFNGASINIDLAVEDSLSRKFIRAIYDYCFNVAKVKRITAAVSEKNEKSISVLKRTGFELECKLEDAHPDGYLLIFKLLKDKCRFIK